MSSLDSNAIAVVCAADDAYAMPLAVTVRSALENLKGNRKIILFIIDGGIKKTNKQKIIRSLVSEKCEIRWIENPDHLLSEIEVLRPFVIENVPNVGTIEEQAHIKISAYYRLLISELLPNHFKKAIYLDSDVIVIGDLGELWDIDIGKNYLLAVQDIAIPYVSSPGGLINYQEIGISANSKYLQSGVLVINLEKWRVNGTSSQCIEYLQKNREYVRWHDTDVLNAILAEKWGELDPRWNQTPFVYQYSSWKDSPFSESIFNDVVYHPYIVHFVSQAKPWNSREEHPFRHLFFHYLDRTDWSGWRFTVWRRLWGRLGREIKQRGSFALPKKIARSHS